eukprot:155172_1
MSTEQKRLELLVFGYVSTTYDEQIPIQLMKVIQLFYDEHFYWILKDKKLNQFIHTKTNEEIICSKSLKIKGLEFKISAYPNGIKDANKDLLFIVMTIKPLPSNIDYIEMYRQVKCETSNSVINVIKKASQLKSKTRFSKIVCQLSELKDIKQFICFSIMINIKYIKYKDEFNRIDYCLPINQMQTYFTFKWNINDLLMEKCKIMKCRRPVYSDSFDNGNWCLMLYPNGRWPWKKGQTDIYLNCLSFPYTLSKMCVQFKLCVDDDNTNIEEMTLTRTCVFTNGAGAHGMKILSFNEFKQRKSLLISITLEIINIYAKDNKITADKKDWTKHG